MKRGDDGISKSLQPSQKLLFETRGSGWTHRVSLRIWSAGSGSPADHQASPPQVSETNCIEQSSVRGTYRVSLMTRPARSWSPADQQASPPQVNEINCTEQSLVRGTYQVSLRVSSAGSGSSVDQQGILILGQRDYLHRAVSPRSRRDQLL